jgi:hypothetical protein
MMRENTCGIKTLHLGLQRLTKVKELAEELTKKYEKRVTANDLVIEAIDEYLKKMGN